MTAFRSFSALYTRRTLKLLEQFTGVPIVQSNAGITLAGSPRKATVLVSEKQHFGAVCCSTDIMYVS